MPERYSKRILKHLADTRYEPRTTHQLARDLNIPREDWAIFEKAVQQLLDEGQLVLGSASTIVLPPPGHEMTGLFRGHERGFGFLVPDEATQHGDLFIPPGATGDARTGDRVRAKVIRDRRRGRSTGKSPFTGRVIEILQRGDRQYVGTLHKRGRQHLVQVDGKIMPEPVLIRDPQAKNATPGDKVVVELLEEPDDTDARKPGQLLEGVITEVLGEAGEPDVETLSVIRAYGLRNDFDRAVADEARHAAHDFDEHRIPDDREDLRDLLTLTIDPPDAKDYDDAISIRKLDPQKEKDQAAWELGVHIADVAHFVKPGTSLDEEAYQRGNSTYLPRKVLPMLPELLSNGVCSLQEGVNRYAKSCFIRYDHKAKILGARFARSVICSDKRLTYLEAQALIDGDLREARKHTKSEPNYPKPVKHALQHMDELARVIRERRLRDGMIVLGLPEVELIFDDAGRVADAQPEDDAFTHTIIEMCMVEANEAAARLFDNLDVPMIRRVHPDPDAHDVGDLRHFARVAGFNIPANPSRKQLQELLEAVRGKPAQHAVHLAVLRTLSKAEYSPMPIGHFALASEHYTHFTSPIRRYPDLIVHRGLDAYLHQVYQSGKPDPFGKPPRAREIAKNLRDDDSLPSEEQLHDIGRHCSTTERNSDDAERDLRNYLVMELLTEHLGEDFDGTVTGVTGNGVFVQLNRFLVDGMVPAAELPGPADERWKLNPNTGALVAQRSGRSISIGNTFTVRIANVDLTRRQMDLVIVEDAGAGGDSAPQKKKKKSKGRRQPAGARKAHQQTNQLKQKQNQNTDTQAAPAKKKKSTKKKSTRRRR